MTMVYLDNNATTPLDPRVLDAMLPYLRNKFGNAASRSHAFGWEAEQAVENAREQVANLIGASAKEIIFTSGATESDNIAIKGVAHMYRDKGNHLIIQETEHKAVIDPAKYLEQTGFEVTVLGVDPHGMIRLEELAAAIKDTTTLVSIMFANNETGTIQPVAQIGKLCKDRGVIFHTDAAQAAGKVPIDVEAMGIDLLSISGHKVHGPKGVGALYVRKGVHLRPIMFGGHDERDPRPGTTNVAGVVGIGAAAQLAAATIETETARLGALRDRLERQVLARIEDAGVNGPRLGLRDGRYVRVPNTTNLYFDYIEAESLVIALDLDGLACSTGAACAAGAIEPSHVLTALGLPADRARASIRLSLGRANNDADVDALAAGIEKAVERLRALSPKTPAKKVVSC
jgi:cysteine desulfurase